MKIELTHEIIAVLSVEAARAILEQLTAELKSDVDERIGRIKTELAQEAPVVEIQKTAQVQVEPVKAKKSVITKDSKKAEFTNGHQLVPQSVIDEIQKRYDESGESLMMIMKDYPQYKYRTIYEYMRLKKKAERVIPYVEPQEEPLYLPDSHIDRDVYRSNDITKEELVVLANKLLDDPKVPLWRIHEMYEGISKDKDSMSINKLAKKYGMTKTSIMRIIDKNCYQNEK